MPFLPELEKQNIERGERARLTRLIDEQRTLFERNKRKVGWLMPTIPSSWASWRVTAST